VVVASADRITIFAIVNKGCKLAGFTPRREETFRSKLFYYPCEFFTQFVGDIVFRVAENVIFKKTLSAESGRREK
jgi:hypothetical protein